MGILVIIWVSCWDISLGFFGYPGILVTIWFYGVVGFGDFTHLEWYPNHCFGGLTPI